MNKLHALQLILATVVVAFLVVSAKPAEVWSSLREVEPAEALAAALMNIAVVLLASTRSALVLRRMGHRVPMKVLVPTTLVGYVAGAVTPAASGELLRIEAMRKGGGVPARDTIALVTYERTLSLYLQLVSVGALLVMISASLPLQALIFCAAVAASVLPWLLAIAVLPLLPAEGSAAGSGLFSRILAYVRVVAGQVQKLYNDLALVLATSLATLLLFAALALQFWLMGLSVAKGLSYGEAWISYGGSTLAAIASLIPFGLGVGDASLAGLIHHFGFSIEQAAVVAVLVRALSFLPMILAALGCYFYLQRPGAFAAEVIPVELATPAPETSETPR